MGDPWFVGSVVHFLFVLNYTYLFLCAGIPGVGFINNILNRYFTLYFPRAIAIAQALEQLGGPEQYIYTTHPWYN
jgi:hypothetical protein